MNSKTFTQPWFIRKGLYYIAGVVLLALTGFEVIDQAQSEAVMRAIQDNVIPLVVGVVPLIAGAKTNAASDSVVTEADVAAARRDALAVAAGDLAESVARQVGARVGDMLTPAGSPDAGLPVFSGQTTS